MPVVFDSAAGGAGTSSSATSFSLSWSHTVGSSTRRIALVYVTAWASAAVPGNPSVQFGNKPMTLVATNANPTGDGRAFLFAVGNPQPGVSTVTVTVSNPNSVSTELNGASVSYSGASGWGDSYSASISGSAMSVTFPAGTDGDLIFAGFSSHGSPSSVTGFSGTERFSTSLGWRVGLLLGDTPGSVDPVVSTATRSGASGGEAIAVELFAFTGLELNVIPSTSASARRGQFAGAALSVSALPQASATLSKSVQSNFSVSASRSASAKAGRYASASTTVSSSAQSNADRNAKSVANSTVSAAASVDAVKKVVQDSSLAVGVTTGAEARLEANASSVTYIEANPSAIQGSGFTETANSQVTAGFNADAFVNRIVNAGLNVSSTQIATGQRVHLATATLSVTFARTGVVFESNFGQSTFIATATASASVQKTLSGSASLTVSSAGAAAGARRHGAEAALKVSIRANAFIATPTVSVVVAPDNRVIEISDNRVATIDGEIRSLNVAPDSRFVEISAVPDWRLENVTR